MLLAFIQDYNTQLVNHSSLALLLLILISYGIAQSTALQEAESIQALQKYCGLDHHTSSPRAYRLSAWL